MDPEATPVAVSCGPAPRDEWERACRSCAYATFFHTPLFSDIFLKATGPAAAAAPLAVRFGDGALAVIPLVRRRYLAGLMRLDWSMPAFTYGGWVSGDTLSAAHCRALAGVLQARADLVWRENPYDPVLGNLDIPDSQDDFTQVIDLRTGFAGAAARFDYAHRKAVRKAVDGGVTVAEASDFDDWKRYISLYEASLERWQKKGTVRSRAYTESLFRALYECPAEHRKLWIARQAGKDAAGIICLYWNGHAAAWLGAGASELFGFRPNNLLYETAIRHAAQAGCRWFDCNPSGGLSGVVEFKTHLGAQKMRSRIVNRRSTARRLAELFRSMGR